MAALEEWRKAFSHLLAPASAIDLEEQIAHLRATSDPQPSQDSPPVGSLTPSTTMRDSDAATVYHGGCIPDAATCDRILETSLHQFLAWNIHTQVELPRSCLSLVSSTLNWLLGIADDVSLLASQRNVAKLFLLLAPKLLWRLPAKLPYHKQREPYARPRLIKRSISLLWHGYWDT